MQGLTGLGAKKGGFGAKKGPKTVIFVYFHFLAGFLYRFDTFLVLKMVSNLTLKIAIFPVLGFLLVCPFWG